ncbi:MAG: penicillin-binding protein activator [Alphaproteobacteria bacterium]|nr:penicillin-binding protein activator [Alphaproteobacteria bacterium]
MRRSNMSLPRFIFVFLSFLVISGCLSSNSNSAVDYGLISPQSSSLAVGQYATPHSYNMADKTITEIRDGDNTLDSIYGNNNRTLLPKGQQVAQLYYLGQDGKYYLGSPSAYNQNDAAYNPQSPYYGGEANNPQQQQLPSATANVPNYNPNQNTQYNQQPQSPPRVRRDGMTRVAMLLPLSGHAKAIGQAFRNASLVAQFKIDFDDFVLQFYDTKGTPEGAEEAATEAISHGVSLILGPLFSDSVKSVKNIAKDSNINVVAFTTDPTAAGDNVFTLGLMLPQQVERLVTYAYENGYQKFAIIAPDNELGKTVVKALKNITNQLGVETSEIGYYSPKATDYTKVVEKITNYKIRHASLKEQKRFYEGKEDPQSIIMLEELKQLDTLGTPNFDAIIIPEQGSKLRSIVSLLSYYDVPPESVKYLGTTLWNNKSLSKEKLLRGGWFPSPPSETHKNFMIEYKNSFNETPPEIASLAFDAVSLASVVAKSGDFSKKSLMNENGFLGVDGIFRLLKNGTSERGLAVMEFSENGIEEISSAPDAFYFPPSEKSYTERYIEENTYEPKENAHTTIDTDEQLIQQGYQYFDHQHVDQNINPNAQTQQYRPHLQQEPERQIRVRQEEENQYQDRYQYYQQQYSPKQHSRQPQVQKQEIPSIKNGSQQPEDQSPYNNNYRKEKKSRFFQYKEYQE